MTHKPFEESADEPSQDLRREESIVLKRKLQFWRRVTSLLGGLVVLVLLVAWQRAEFSRAECGESLEMYAAEAARQKLATAQIEFVDTIWQNFEIPQARRFPKHYLLLVTNWQKQPGDENIPLAVCETSHSTLLGIGRNVLYRNRQGFVVQWLSEAEAEPLARQARKSQP